MSRRGAVGAAIALAVVVAIAAVAWTMLHPGTLPQREVTPGAVAASPATQVIAARRIPRARRRLRSVPHRAHRQAFAGGRAMPTPFGNLYVPNITPDDETGIGQWTADDFYRMMHTGISRDGTLLYPAMPFASYTKVTRDDCDAIFAYLSRCSR